MNRQDRRDLARSRALLRAFGRDEDGSMVIFAMFLLLVMIIVGGMAVDLMRFESHRSRLQATLDRAVLAAADLDQTLDPEQVVYDYFAKAGLADNLTGVTVVENFNSRSVSAEAQLAVNMTFMKFLGIDSWTIPADGAAIESKNEVEVALVLDVSGSMGRDGRIQALRPAAQEFVTTVLDNSEPGDTSISIVPYSTQVNLGPDLYDQYNTNDFHAFSQCLNLPGATYTDTAILPTVALDQTAHFDPDSYAGNWSQRTARRFVCNPDTRSHVLPFSQNETALRAHIGNLVPYEWTSIEMGAKWGVAMLDPATRPVVDGLISDGVVDTDFSGRPFDYSNQNALKVLVLMTDGENTRHYELDPSIRSGLSDVWFSNNAFYVNNEEPGDRDGDGRWREQSYRPHNNTWTNGLPGTRLTWPELFNLVNLDGHAWYFRRNQTGNNAVFNQWMGGMLTQIDQAAKDTRLLAICEAAKDEGIVIFTIGFMVSNRSAGIMEECASSPSHFYRIEDLNIDTAFNSIANQISNLRLLQ